MSAEFVQLPIPELQVVKPKSKGFGPVTTPGPLPDYGYRDRQSNLTADWYHRLHHSGPYTPKVEATSVFTSKKDSGKRLMEKVSYTLHGKTLQFDRYNKPQFKTNEDGSYTYDPKARMRSPIEGKPPSDLPMTIKFAELIKSLEPGQQKNFAMPGEVTIMKRLNGVKIVDLKDDNPDDIELQAIVYFNGVDDKIGVTPHAGWDDKTETVSFVSAHYLSDIGVVYEIHRGTQAAMRAQIEVAEKMIDDPNIQGDLRKVQDVIRVLREDRAFIKFPSLPISKAA